ncbi:MAG: hypothetical protein IKN77_01325 [Paludibacteraceae bacterium]|nr:hypothetical protein [Paludibacteraceae bacterium]
MNKNYDSTDINSIFNYSKGLLNHTLREFVSSSYKARKGKGGLGEMVEEIYFGYDKNNNPEADFSVAGVELKCTPLKKSKKGELLIKERLVCGMIDYVEEAGKDFEHSHFYEKCRLMLLLFYLHIAQAEPLDLEFLFSVLWKLPEKDLLIIRNDYNIIHDKIIKGLAHTLTEGDTLYLSACRKGSKASDVTKQFNSDIPAPTRAFSLKTAYMRTILEYVKKNKGNAISNIKLPKGKETVSVEELRSFNFEEIIFSRFKPHIGKNEKQLENELDLDLSSNSKNKFFQIANAIAGNKKCGNVNHSEEFQKSGLMMKTIRVQANGKIKEAMSFENIDYQEIFDNDNWYDSRLYEIFTNRFLFVVYREQTPNTGDYVLDKIFFWTMPQEDIKIAESYWNDIRKNVLGNTIDSQYFWSASLGRLFHVRPKGRNSNDLADNPHGGKCKKFCYWFNNEYITSIVNND